jgi:hypothetical protein
VPGTMKPSSRRDSGVFRGEAVYAMTSLPIACATRATVAQLAFHASMRCLIREAGSHGFRLSLMLRNGEGGRRSGIVEDRRCGARRPRCLEG